MERETGLEPATNSLEGCDSTVELLPLNPRFVRVARRFSSLFRLRCGAGGGTRTHDRLITNQMLYQLSYAGARRPK